MKHHHQKVAPLLLLDNDVFIVNVIVSIMRIDHKMIKVLLWRRGRCVLAFALLSAGSDEDGGPSNEQQGRRGLVLLGGGHHTHHNHEGSSSSLTSSVSSEEEDEKRHNSAQAGEAIFNAAPEEEAQQTHKHGENQRVRKRTSELRTRT